MITYNTILILSWAAFLLVWGIGAFSVKRDIKGGGIFSWWSRFFLLRVAIWAGIVLVVLRIVTGTTHYTNSSLLPQDLFTPPVFLGWIGAFLAVLGIAFAIWARVHLGRNWSPSPAVKEHHELVTSGPYRFVQHPIYTGVIRAALGAALTGSFFGIALFILGSLMFSFRIGKEEKIVLDLFPNEYPAYQKRAKILVPFVW